MSGRNAIKAALFWLSVTGLTLVVGYQAYQDTIREPVDCPASPPGKSAFLVLRTLETDTKQIKGTLFVSDFDPAGDRLTVNSVSPGSDPKTASYETVLKVTPTPSPTPGPRADAPGSRPWRPVGLLYDSQSFFYPFEEYVLNVQLDFEKADELVPINLKVVNQVDEAVIVKKCAAGYSFDAEAQEPNSFNFVLQRHRFVRLTALILYSVAFVFLVFIATREETSKVLTNSLGYMAALWGVRAIIVGSVKLFPTVVDFVTLGLYLAVFSIVTYKWLFGSRTPPEKGVS